MNIKKFEFKKIVSSPIFIVLTLIFLAYNTMIIMNKSYIRNDLKVLNEIVDEIGYQINDEMMLDFKAYYEERLKYAKDILKENGYESYDTIGDFFENNYVNENSNLSLEEIEFLSKLSNIESYYFLVNNLDEKYEFIEINKITEGDLSRSPYNDNINDIIRKNYDEFETRFEELKENGEQKNLFFYGRAYKMHSLLFKDIFKAMTYEIMILIVLVTSFILNYEFENKTSSITYSTKRGRNLIKDKLTVSLISTILIATIIIGVTLLIYFSVFDYSGLWSVSINSFFAQEFNMPYLTWWDMSVAKYLMLVITVTYILETIFCGITFVLSTIIKNSYVVFGVFVIMSGLLVLLPTIIPSTFNIVMLTAYTPFALILNESWWFMLKSSIATYKYYEVVTLVSWSLGVLIMGALCVNKFRKDSIK